jgi:hypothetical protein
MAVVSVPDSLGEAMDEAQEWIDADASGRS